MSAYSQLLLTCASKKEATKIADVLLKKRLIACAKQASIESAAWWQGKIENTDEILLIMDSREDLFDEIETEIAKLHSYDTFVLQSILIQKISKKADNWLEDTLKK